MLKLFSRVLTTSVVLHSKGQLKRGTLCPALERLLSDANKQGEFIAACEEKLGYTTYLRIDAAFKTLGIQPFTSTSVDTYMRAEAKRHVMKYYFSSYGGMYRRIDNAYLDKKLGELVEQFRMEGWQAFHLADYKDFVPEEALNQALELGALLPGATFTVVAFKPNEVSVHFAVIDDPFLRLDYEGCEVYFAVWDEPGFTAAILPQQSEGQK